MRVSTTWWNEDWKRRGRREWRAGRNRKVGIKEEEGKK
jgi:hypothetical protein